MKRSATRSRRVAFRVLLSIGVGVLAGYIAATNILHDPAHLGRDFTQLWLAARDVLHGLSPYHTPDPSRPYPTEGYFPYPLPAALLAVPLTSISVGHAAVVATALGIGAFAFAATERSLLILAAVILSRSFERAVVLAQVAPLVIAGAGVAPLGLLAVIKPNLGLAVMARRPSWWVVLGGVVLLGLSFLLQPGWVIQWLQHTNALPFYAPACAVLKGGGPLLLLSILRWRDPDARFLLALSVVPMNFIWYDQLALFLVARTGLEAALLSLGSWLSFAILPWIIPAGMVEPAAQAYFRAPIVALMYLPALVMVLRRRNEGAVPVWVENVLDHFRLPCWLRGQQGADA